MAVTLLLDAYNLLFRSFASLPPAITDSNRQPINAVYGMIAAILRFNREFIPASIVAAFDVPDIPTFRHELYPAYQAQRGPLGGDASDEFARQVEMARLGLPALGIAALSAPRFEADDIMGTLARRLTGQAIIVSTDRDLLQLVDDRISVVSPADKSLVLQDASAVERRLGVTPGGITTWKALAGDASDNIPGLAGIGAKTAASLVQQYGDLEEIYRHLDALPARVRKALEGNQERAELFRDVVTIRTDLDLPTAALPTPRFPPDSQVRSLLRQMGYP